jgi:hypothetical protein
MRKIASLRHLFSMLMTWELGKQKASVGLAQVKEEKRILNTPLPLDDWILSFLGSS